MTLKDTYKTQKACDSLRHNPLIFKDTPLRLIAKGWCPRVIPVSLRVYQKTLPVPFRGKIGLINGKQSTHIGQKKRKEIYCLQTIRKTP